MSRLLPVTFLASEGPVLAATTAISAVKFCVL
jgi:hypothetical protein